MVIMAMHCAVRAEAFDIDHVDCTKHEWLSRFTMATGIATLNNAVQSDYCGKEWSTYGTCCKPSSYADYVRSSNRGFEAQVEHIVGTMSGFSNLVNKLQHELEVTSKLPETEGHSNNERSAVANKLLEDPYMIEYFERFSSNQFVEANEREYLENCLPIVESARNSLTCFVCSGRAKIFLKQGSLALENKDCSMLAEHCAHALTSLNKYAQGIDFFTNFLDPLISMGVGITSSATVKVDGNAIAKLHAVGASPSVRNSLARYLNSKDQDSVDKLCYHLASAGKPTPWDIFTLAIDEDVPWELDNIITEPLEEEERDIKVQADILSEEYRNGLGKNTPIDTHSEFEENLLDDIQFERPKPSHREQSEYSNAHDYYNAIIRINSYMAPSLENAMARHTHTLRRDLPNSPSTQSKLSLYLSKYFSVFSNNQQKNDELHRKKVYDIDGNEVDIGKVENEGSMMAYFIPNNVPQ